MIKGLLTKNLIPGTFVIHYKNPSKLYTYMGLSKITKTPIKKEFLIANCFKHDNDDQIFKLYNKDSNYHIFTNDQLLEVNDSDFVLYRSHDNDRRIWVRQKESFEQMVSEFQSRFSVYRVD